MERHLLLLRKAALCLAVVMTLLLAWRLISDKNSRVSVESLFVPVSLMGEYSVDGSPWLQLCRLWHKGWNYLLFPREFFM